MPRMQSLKEWLLLACSYQTRGASASCDATPLKEVSAKNLTHRCLPLPRLQFLLKGRRVALCQSFGSFHPLSK